jgi:hypothetical protein
MVFLPVVGKIVEDHAARISGETRTSSEGVAQSGTDAEVDRGEADSLRHREAFLEARHAVAKSERIGLVLDLSERVLYIETHGVTLRACSLASVRVSKAARRAIRAAEAPEGPVFVLSAEYATVPKAPIRHVDAPRDTAEANARPPLETPVETRGAHSALHFGEAIRLRIAPDTRNVGDGLAGFILDVRERVRDLRGTLGLISDARLPRPVPWIRLEMSPVDTRAVYRALPPEAHLAVRL